MFYHLGAVICVTLSACCIVAWLLHAIPVQYAAPYWIVTGSLVLLALVFVLRACTSERE